MEVGRQFTGAEGMPNGYVMAPDGVWIELQEDPSLHVPIAGYHIHFITPDYEELLAWYTEVFGLHVRPRGRIQTSTDVPGMNMSFGNAEEATAATRGRALDHIGFEVDDLEAFCQKLEAMGIEFDVAYREVESVELKIAFLTSTDASPEPAPATAARPPWPSSGGRSRPSGLLPRRRNGRPAARRSPAVGPCGWRWRTPWPREPLRPVAPRRSAWDSRCGRRR